VVEPTELPAAVLDKGFGEKLLRAIFASLNGVFRMSPDIEGLVQTSNNLARVRVADGKYEIMCLTRGSVDSEKLDLACALRCAFELMGAEVELRGDYPGWVPKPDASIVKLLAEVYEELFNEKAKVMACHAGLECGILGANYPDVQMISFGPNIRGPHSPDEKVQVSSVQKYWKLLKEILQRIP
jgi:dipeptidase D